MRGQGYVAKELDFKSFCREEIAEMYRIHAQGSLVLTPNGTNQKRANSRNMVASQTKKPPQGFVVFRGSHVNMSVVRKSSRDILCSLRVDYRDAI